MDEFSLYQWLVLGLLALIAFLIWAVGTGVEKDLQDMTRRLESAIGRVREILAPDEDKPHWERP